MYYWVSATIIVRLDFSKSEKQTERRSKALRRSWCEKNALKKSTSTEKSCRGIEKKKCKRLERKLHNSPNLIANTEGRSESQVSQNQELTPKSKTSHEIRKCGMSPSSLPKRIVKRLELSNYMMKEIEVTQTENKKRKEKSVINRIVSGNISRKYRLGYFLKKD
jgi:hypothetical protein